MYKDIALRNHQAIQRNGYKLVENWKQDDTLKHFVISYQDCLNQMETLFKAANILVNR